MSTLAFDGVEIRIDATDMIGWMSDWAPLYDERDWVGSGLVESVSHNSGGLGGASYRLTDTGKRYAADYAEGHNVGVRHVSRGRAYNLPFGHTIAWVRGYQAGYESI